MTMTAQKVVAKRLRMDEITGIWLLTSDISAAESFRSIPHHLCGY